MLVHVIGYALTILFAVISFASLIGAFRRTRLGVLAAVLRLYMFAVFGVLSLLTAYVAGI